jgi:ribonuclease T2
VDERVIERMLPLMPSRGLILHQWRKHGSCSGLAPDAYFEATRRAREQVKIPARYEALERPMVTTVVRLEADIMAANPRLTRGGIATQCSGRFLREVRLCLDRALNPRLCSPDTRDRCGPEVVLRPTRGG